MELSRHRDNGIIVVFPSDAQKIRRDVCREHARQMGRHQRLLSLFTKMKIAYIGIAYVYYESHFLKLLDAHYDVDFFFYGGEERYIGKEVRSYADKKPALARAQYLKGFHVFPRLKITPGLIAKLWRGNYDVIIKGIVGRFALPASFITAKLLGKKFILLTDIWQHPRSLAHCFSYWLLKAVYRYSDAICAYGNHVRDFVVSQGAREEKIFVMPFATDNALFDRTVAPQTRSEENAGDRRKESHHIRRAARAGKGRGISFARASSACPR